MPATTDQLADLELFGGCTAEDLRSVLPTMSERRFGEGDVLCVEGDKADRWWIVTDGTADVTTEGLYTATVGPGETIGELALLDGEPRSSTVRAVSDMVVLEVEGDAFVDALATSPQLSLAIMRELAGRLRAANRRPDTPRADVRSATAAITAPTAAPSADVFDPFAGDYRVAPWRQLGALRERAAVQWSDVLESYLVLDYDDVSRLLKDRSLTGSVTTGTVTVNAATAAEPERRGRTDKMMIRRDGADHLRLRRLLSKAFTPRAVQRWRERTESIVDRKLDEADEAEHIDVIHDFALPIPTLVISEMLGVPSDDNAQLQAWSDVLIKNLEPGNTPERQAEVEGAGRAMLGYLEALVDDRRSRLGDELLSAMLAAEDNGDILDDGEIQAQVMLLYIAGHETTVNLIGNGLHHLFDSPEQLARFQVDPALDANAVEELLRFDSPAQFTRRVTHQPIELGGVEIPEHSLLALSLSAANHDPAKWGDTADVVDVSRTGANEHVSFGGGPHFCLGAALARMEGQIALSGLIRRFPKLERETDEPSWADRVVLRGLTKLPVRVR